VYDLSEKMPAMGHTRKARIWFVYERFEQLRALLEHWGWEIIERGDLSRWHEQGHRDPVLGLVSIRGRRTLPLGGEATVTIKEWWGEPPLGGPERRQGRVLAGYHYTAQSPERQVRHCYDTVRHPDVPFHVHLHGDAEISPTAPVTPEQALALFEQRLAEELRRGVAASDPADAGLPIADNVPPGA
jgi:hypothetical protein